VTRVLPTLLGEANGAQYRTRSGRTLQPKDRDASILRQPQRHRDRARDGGTARMDLWVVLQPGRFDQRQLEHMRDDQTRNALIEFGFAFNEYIAEAEAIIEDVKAELDGLDRRACLLLRAAGVKTTAESLRDDVLRHLDALDRAA
jgi:hypothetical protein